MYDNQLFYLTTLTNLYIMTNLKKYSGIRALLRAGAGATALGGPQFAGSGQNCFMQLVESKMQQQK